MNGRKLLSILMMALPIINLAIATTLAITPAAEPSPLQEEAGLGKFLGMALSTGLAAVGAGIAVGHSGSAAIASITEKPELFGRAIIIVGLAEGIAIYGLLISFLIWIS